VRVSTVRASVPDPKSQKVVEFPFRRLLCHQAKTLGRHTRLLDSDQETGAGWPAQIGDMAAVGNFPQPWRPVLLEVGEGNQVAGGILHSEFVGSVERFVDRQDERRAVHGGKGLIQIIHLKE